MIQLAETRVQETEVKGWEDQAHHSSQSKSIRKLPRDRNPQLCSVS